MRARLDAIVREEPCAEAGQSLTVADKVIFAADVANFNAKGMAHLSACKFVHRNLAARNVLIDAVYCCKIADFGLSQAVAPGTSGGDSEGQYYRSARGQFPVRWTAPEAMQTMKFTTETDVWGYGCFNDGAQPYAGSDNLTVMTSGMAGKHDTRPAAQRRVRTTCG